MTSSDFKKFRFTTTDGQKRLARWSRWRVIEGAPLLGDLVEFTLQEAQDGPPWCSHCRLLEAKYSAVLASDEEPRIFSRTFRD